MESTDIIGIKAQMRRSIRAARRALSEQERAQASRLVAERLFELEPLRSAKYVLCYMPMRYELDILPSVEKLRSAGVIPVFPLCVEDGGLRLYVPAERNGFVTGAYGILEPDTSTAREIGAEELSAIILPAVGFDRQGMRLGQGGGYYDRLLARCECFPVAVGFDCQLVESVPAEPTDRRVRAIVTPSETILL